MKITITPSAGKKARPSDDKLGFGQVFTDRMFLMEYDPKQGWHDARIVPYGPLSLDPATMVFHYGQAIFEGLKAYRNPAGGIQLFRPMANMERFNRSADLLCIPRFDPEFALLAVKKLVDLERDWVPSAPGTSLYIRPFIFAKDAFLGVRASSTYYFLVILSPVGAYYPEGFAPVKIWVSKSHVRAVKGGVGEAKTSGNYAASLLAGQKAHDQGYTQVLWLDGVERKFVEEVGSMNIFFVVNGEITTPALSGSILPGITRDSVLALARHWGLPVSERAISIDEVFSAHESGALTEVFGAGTAAVISPVGELKYGDRSITIGSGKVGPMAEKLYKSLTDIQYGRSEDPLGWIVPV